MNSLKKKSLLLGAAAGAALVVAPSADAAFTVTYTSAVTGSDTTYYFQAVNDGLLTGTTLLAENVTAITPGTTTSTAMVVDMFDFDGDGVPDANVIGASHTGTAAGLSLSTSTVTFMRISTYKNYDVGGVTPAAYETDPGGSGFPTQSVDPAYSNLHMLNVQGFTTSTTGTLAGIADSTPQTFAVVTVPTGTPLTLSGLLAGNTGVATAFATINIGQGNPTTTHTIVSLTSTAPTGYGSQLTAPSGTATFTPGGATSTAITVNQLGGPTSYLPGFAHVTGAAGSTEAFVQVNLSAGPVAGATEIYGLHLLVNGVTPTSGQIAQIITDINAQTASDGGITASTLSPAVASEFGSIYNLELTGPAGSTTFLAFDFSGETNVGGISVADVAAVPEPATAVGLLVGAGSLLLGRRKNRVA